MSAPDALRACTRLTRLTLHNHAVWGTAATGTVGLPAAWGDRLMDALAAMPSLRLVEDVVNPQRPEMLVPAVARCMWELGRRCPHVRLEQLTTTYVSGLRGVWALETSAWWPVFQVARAAARAGCWPALCLLLTALQPPVHLTTKHRSSYLLSADWMVPWQDAITSGG